MSGSGTGTPTTGVASGGGWSMVVAPTIEPITLAELKLHLRLDSGSTAEDLTTTQVIAPGSHGVSAGSLYTHVGTAVDVLGKTAIAHLNAGAVGSGGTVDAKLQESDDNTTWVDWTGGAFTQVTAANDLAIQEKAYTGTRQYLRVVAKVLVAACEFGADILVLNATSAEDSLLTDLIATARGEAETITKRALLTSTWDYSLQAWPRENFFRLPYGNLQSVSSLKWKNTSGTETTLTAGTDYIVVPKGDQYGRVVLPYGVSWPSGTLYPEDPIVVRYVCGWTTAAGIPAQIRTAVKFIAENDHQHGGRNDVLKERIESLLFTHTLFWEF